LQLLIVHAVEDSWEILYTGCLITLTSNILY